MTTYTPRDYEIKLLDTHIGRIEVDVEDEVEPGYWRVRSRAGNIWSQRKHRGFEATAYNIVHESKLIEKGD